MCLEIIILSQKIILNCYFYFPFHNLIVNDENKNNVIELKKTIQNYYLAYLNIFQAHHNYFHR